MIHQRPHIKNIAFFGDADLLEDDPIYQDAYKLAQELVQKGYTIVNGGGPGIMNAATQGAESVGGETLSVTFTPTNAPGFEGRYVGNITDHEIKTTNYIERMFKLMEHSDIFLIFKGGTGTISELGTAWVLAKLYYGYHKPFILVGSFWHPIIKAIHENLNIDEAEMNVFKIVDSKEQVLPAIADFETQMQHSGKGHSTDPAERAFMR